MSKSFRMVAVLVIAAITFSGCDFLRTLAGRPTSADLQAIRSGVPSTSAGEKAETVAVDAPTPVVDAAAEAAAADSLRAAGVPMRNVNELRNRLATTPSQRYCFIVGMFSMEENALRVAAQVDSAGYKYELIRYANGNTLVGTVPSPTLCGLYSVYSELREKSFFPKESWVLENR